MKSSDYDESRSPGSLYCFLSELPSYRAFKMYNFRVKFLAEISEFNF